MHKVLLVEDSDIDRLIAGRLLQKEGAFEVTVACNGKRALDAMRLCVPDVIVTDLQMPEMDGLELVEAVRAEFPSIPVVLMTYRGSEEIAAEALRRGAASYVPKQCLAEKLRETVKRIVASLDISRGRSRLMRSLEETDCRFRLQDPELIEPLVLHLQELLSCQSRCNDVERLRLGLAVKHALWIAHYHGNLEISADPLMSDEQFEAFSLERQKQPPFHTRSLIVHIQMTAAEAKLTIIHEGPGIDDSKLSDVCSTVVASHSWLRGFVLIPSSMSEVSYSGNSIRLRHIVTAD